MDEQKIYEEVLKAGLKVTGDNLPKVISKINKSRLEEKKKRKEKDENSFQKSVSIELNDKEKLSGSLTLNIENAKQNIEKHISEISRWANIVSFSDLDKRKTLGTVYIQLDTYLLPAKRHFSFLERNKTIALEKAVLDGPDHCIILGQPGAGKTTSLKKICDIIIKERRKTNYNFPILLRLREIGKITTNTPILEFISKVFPFEFEFRDYKESRFSVGEDDARKESIISFLNEIGPIIILDGFDELKDSNAKTIVLSELRILAEKLTTSKLVVSCRTGEFNYELNHTRTFEIAPLTQKQIELFVNKWLNDKIKALDFLLKVKNSPFADTSIKPLSLAHLCTIYDRIGNIPEQPKTIYKKVVNLLIEEWDEQRSIIRESEFSSFQSDQKFEFLTHLSYILTVTHQATIFTKEQIHGAYQNICEDHDLPKTSSSKVVSELESHTGLFIESGYEKFEFVHKSIQEYLSADYLVKLPSLNTVRKHFESLSSELAIAVSISSNPSLYFVELVLNYFLRLDLSSSFYSSFTSRIISENPTFNANKLVSVASLALISRWINPDNKNFNTMKVSDFDTGVYSSFINLADCLNLKEQKVSIFEYYLYEKNIHENKFVELIRIQEPENHKRLPSKIYLPLDFYMQFSN
jgi:predicted NACHT family NTPase